MISNTDFILARSPYYITYSATASTFDYVSVNLEIWTGESTSTNRQTYPLTAFKTSVSDNYITIEISDYILGHLEPVLDNTWYDYLPITVDTTDITTDTTEITTDTEFLYNMPENQYQEFCWVKWVLKSYKISSNSVSLSDTITSALHIGSMGYGYHTDGNNPTPPSMTLLDPIDKYSTQLTTNFLTTISTTASNTNQIVLRQPIFTNNIICSQRNRVWEIAYLNRFGIWDTFLFNKASKRVVSVESETSQFYQQRPDAYSLYAGTTRVQNVSSNEEWTINTDLLDDAQNSYLEELISSDRWYLLNRATNTIVPVIYVDKKIEEKLSYYEKAKVQWTLKFEGANSKINDIR